MLTALDNECYSSEIRIITSVFFFTIQQNIEFIAKKVFQKQYQELDLTQFIHHKNHIFCVKKMKLHFSTKFRTTQSLLVQVMILLHEYMIL